MWLFVGLTVLVAYLLVLPYDACSTKGRCGRPANRYLKGKHGYRTIRPDQKLETYQKKGQRDERRR